jgi:ketopantoate reductase
MGDYRSIPETRSLLSVIMQEVESVARAQGVNLDADVVQQWLDFIDNAAPTIKPSMQLDVEAGHRTELESMTASTANHYKNHLTFVIQICKINSIIFH